MIFRERKRLWTAGTLVGVLTLVSHLGCVGTPLAKLPQLAADKATAGKTLSQQPTTKSDELPDREAARACLVTAQELQSRGHNREAIILFERARQLDPKLPGVARSLGALYDREGDRNRALNEYRAAMQQSAVEPDLLNDIGFHYFQLRDWPQAEQWFRKALAEQPEHERATINLGMSLAWQGKFQPAYETFARAVGPAAAHSNVGVIMAQQGRLNEARQAFENAVALQPDLKQANAFLAYLNSPQSAALVHRVSYTAPAPVASQAR